MRAFEHAEHLGLPVLSEHLAHKTPSWHLLLWLSVAFGDPRVSDAGGAGRMDR